MAFTVEAGSSCWGGLLCNIGLGFRLPRTSDPPDSTRTVLAFVAYAAMPGLYGARDGVQGFVHTRQALDQLSHKPQPHVTHL